MVTKSKRKAESAPWWQTMWQDFRPFFAMIPPAEINRQVAYLIRKLNLRKGSTLLDCPSGFGRLSIPFARKGVRVTAVDIHKPYLDELVERSTRAGVTIPIIHSDMRKINLRNRFDAVANLWTSFGYFEDESDHALVLRKFHQALRPGGRLVVHVMNRDWIVRHFQSSDWLELGGTICLEKRAFDFRRSVIRTVWRYLRDGRTTEFNVSLRLFSFHELAAMMEEAGLEEIEGFGSMKDEPISAETRMMWLFARKPKR